MSVEITGRYLGNKRTELLHVPSNSSICTAAPKDNQGDGSTFSPSDLVAAAAGACMMTIIGILAERDSLDVSGMHFHLEKQMNSAPRRIARLPIRLHLPQGLPVESRVKYERAALTCPVHQSLNPQIEIVVDFLYDI